MLRIDIFADMKRSVILLLAFLLCIPAFSAQPDDKDKYQRMLVALATVIDGDTVPSVELAEVVMYGKRIYPSPRKQRQYDKLTRNVIQMYPIALEVKATASVANIDESQQAVDEGIFLVDSVILEA